MKKFVALLAVLFAGVALSGCEALSLAENVKPYFAGAEFENSENYYKDYYYPLLDFEEAPEAIFQPMSYGTEYLDKALYLTGTVEDTVREDGIKYYLFSTQYGTIYISNRLFTLEKIKEGTVVRMYFVYSGYHDALSAITGAYVNYSVLDG